MQLCARIGFWDEGVACFCHEALVRALRDFFGDVSVGETDLAHEKYRRVADEPSLERSAWFEFLRNGPAHTFTLSSGATGKFSRYSIVFDLPEVIPEAEVHKVREFLHSLKLGKVMIEE